MSQPMAMSFHACGRAADISVNRALLDILEEPVPADDAVATAFDHFLHTQVLAGGTGGFNTI